jgi:hypothetical protein
MRTTVGARVAILIVVLALGALAAPPGQAQTPASKNLAPGFSALPKTAKVVVMPTDIELFSISGGGVLEPKADWTEAASKFFRAALASKQGSFGVQTSELTESQADQVAELNFLHAAVARAIAIHHFGPLALPTKEGKLDWSLGDAVQDIRKLSGADFALFTWVRDSYASDERKAAMVAMAMLGVGLVGGSQTGYASLVDLSTGRVVWFNRLQRARGDLRDSEKAAETVDVLLEQFPAAK